MRRAAVARVVAAATLVLVAALSVAAAQRGRGGRGGWGGVAIAPNAAYDGRVTFARIRYTEHGRSGWEYDYPDMERNFMTIVRELTTLRPNVRESNVHALSDSLLLRYPVAYLSEPGYWIPDSAEVAGLRTYLAKGGFLIVDDFMRGEWTNFETQLRRVLPDAPVVRLTAEHPIFDAFFTIESLDMTYPGNPRLRAEFLGVHEDGDPAKRLMVIINYNTDIGDYMEWSGEGWWPVNLTNDAYKLATNYLVYGMTRRGPRRALRSACRAAESRRRTRTFGCAKDSRGSCGCTRMDADRSRT